MRRVHHTLQPLPTAPGIEAPRMATYSGAPIVTVHEADRAGDITYDIAAASLDLLASAYGAEFEGPREGIPEGTFRRHFDSTDDAKVTGQARQMRASIEAGSIYGFILDPESQDRQLALAKVSPFHSSTLQKMRLVTPNAHLDAIAVEPSHQKQGLGSVLLYDLLTSGYFDRARSLELGNPGSRGLNRWAQRLGMFMVGRAEPIVIDRQRGLELPATHCTSNGLANLGDIATRLKRLKGIDQGLAAAGVDK